MLSSFLYYIWESCDLTCLQIYPKWQCFWGVGLGSGGCWSWALLVMQWSPTALLSKQGMPGQQCYSPSSWNITPCTTRPRARAKTSICPHSSILCGLLVRLQKPHLSDFPHLSRTLEKSEVSKSDEQRSKQWSQHFSIQRFLYPRMGLLSNPQLINAC